jgi:hypothetical protein
MRPAMLLTHPDLLAALTIVVGGAAFTAFVSLL